jgi:predicted small metal-binding protein
MPIFTCGHHFSDTYCQWDAAEHTTSKLITKIAEHAKTAHNMDQISHEQLTFIDAIDLLRLKLQQLEADLTLSYAIHASSSTTVSPDFIKQTTLLRWKSAIQTYPHDELQWMLIEEVNMKNNCPLHLVVNGIRADFPVPRSCIESHCPHRFNCVLHD